MTRLARRRPRLAIALGAGAVLAAPAALSAPTALTQQAIAEAEKPLPYPSFADAPPVPKDVRPVDQWKADVVAARLAGQRLAREVEATPWTLSGTEAFAEEARSEARPPAPLTTPMDAATEALVRAMKARAMPPPRRR